jgi:hypothetical protein
MYDPGTLYVDPILTNFSVGWADQQLFGWQLFPETPVNTQSGRYRVFDRSNWMIHRSRREPMTVANEVGAGKWSEDTFKTQEHSLQAAIADEERQQLMSQGGLANNVFGGDLAIDPERDAVDYIVRSIMLEHEKKVADTIRNAANYASAHKTTLTSGGTGTRWDNYALATAGDVGTAYSNPVANIKTAVMRIYLDTGRWPNTLVLPFDAVGVIENHPRVVARYQYTSVFDANAWKAMIGIPEAVQFKTIVVDSKYNSADNVDATESIASLWGQDAWVGIVDPSPGQKTFTFGKTFAQTYPNGTTRPSDRWREEPRKADLVRTSYKYDLKIVSALAGYLITTAVSAVT